MAVKWEVMNTLEKYPGSEIVSDRGTCQYDSSISSLNTELPFSEMGTLERDGDGEDGRFGFAVVKLKLPVSHPSGVIRKAGDMWHWYSEHRSVPERHIFEISPFASTDFS